MPLLGNGLIAIWNDITDEMRNEFFEWHPREHMHERMGVPGFRRGRRYIATDADIEFFTLYEASEPELLTSQVYKDRLSNPSDWSLKVLPHFRNNLRGICRPPFTDGYADGGNLATLRISAEGFDRAELMAFIKEELTGKSEKPNITGTHLLECDVELSSGNKALQRGRTISVPDLVVLIEGSTVEAVKDCAQAFLSILEAKWTCDVSAGYYDFEYQVMNYPS